MKPTTANDGKPAWKIRFMRFRWVALPLWLAFMLSMNIIDNPRLKDIRGTEILRLIAFGMLLGVGIVQLADWIRSKLHKDNVQ